MTNTPYICCGMTIKTQDGREGKVVGVDTKAKVVVAYNKKSIFTRMFKDIKEVRY